MTLHDLIKHKDGKLETDIVILDISKAFEAVPHDKVPVLYRLRHYGITGDTFGGISAQTTYGSL